MQTYSHRRRIQTEAKAKVVVSVWGAEFIQFLAALAVFLSVDLEEKVEILLFFQIDRGKIVSAAKN